MSLAFCTRYIDDLWNPLVEETTFRSVTAQMYPEWLPLGKPEARGQEINYLDMSIKHNNGTQNGVPSYVKSRWQWQQKD